MLELAVAAFAVVSGLIIIWQGIRAVLGKRRFGQDAATRAALESVSEKQRATTARALGFLRIALGLFFVALGAYLAVGVF